MTQHPLQPLLAPRSIAFVGASARRDTPGNDMMRAIRRGGFAGEVYAINPGYAEVEGYPCLPSLRDLKASPDLVVLGVRNDRLEATMAEAIDVGARAAVIFASGHLAEDTDPPLRERLAVLAREAGIPVCGGNCMGFYNELDHVWVCGFPSPREPLPGGIAFIAHSGSVFGALAHNDPRLRFALAVSPGQEFTTTVAHYLDYVVERPEVKVVGLFLETARDPQGFVRALEKAARRRVPVVALKVGRSAAAASAALSHTGAIVGSDAAFDALCDRYGVIRVDTIDELGATLLLLATGRRAGPGGLVSIHDSGGEREMMLDLAERVGIGFAHIGEATKVRLASRLEAGLAPENPLDAWGTGQDFVPLFTGCFGDLVADENAALGLFCVDFRDGSYLYDGFAEAAMAVARTTEKPIALATNYTQVRHDRLARRLADAGLPLLDGTAQALIAIRAALAYRDFLARPADPAPPPPAETATARAEWLACLVGGGALGETDALELLAAWGVPSVPFCAVDDVDAAAAAAAALGYPVVAKTAAPEIRHKSEVGGVHLGLADEATLRRAYEDLARRLGSRVTVARMAGRGVELALGMVRDPQFGPVVMIGAGGTLVELLADRVTALAPFGPETARRLIDRLAVRRLLDGYRGAPAADLEALVLLLARFSVLAADLADDVAEIDINPLICSADGNLALDALIIPRRKG